MSPISEQAATAAAISSGAAIGALPQHDVFISYNSEDEESAQLLTVRLRDVGLTVWFDKHSMQAGRSWSEQLGAAIKACSSIVVAIGPSGLGPVQGDEAQFAYQLNRARTASSADERSIIPVLFAGGRLPAEPPLWLSGNAISLDDSFSGREFERLVVGIKGLAVADEQLPDTPAPYRGLEAFVVEDHEFFTGRDEEIAAMREKLLVHPFLAVLGGSGSGKTSLVQAGLLASLQAEPPAGPKLRYLPIVRPGSDPLRAFAVALLDLQPAADRLEAVDDLLRRLRADPDGAPALLRTLAPLTRVVLVVDRLEEVFTLATDDQSCSDFVRVLVAIARAPEASAWVLATLRSDFYEQLARHPDLVKEVADHQIYVPELKGDALRNVIVRPAARVRAIFEHGLKEQVYEEASRANVALPLLQYALSELWRKRRGRFLRWDAYRTMGGVVGALRTHAEEVVRAFSPAELAAARRMLTRLVWLDGNSDKRAGRRTMKSELVDRSTDSATSETVLETLAAHRLIVIDRDVDDGRGMVALAHDSLATHWDRLGEWIWSDREFVRWRESLRVAVSQWVAGGRDSGLLLQSKSLELARPWLARRDDLTLEECDFLDGSQVREDAARRAERLRRWAAIAAVVVIVGVLGLFGYQWRQTIIQRQTARAGGIVTSALAQLDSDPELGLLLAREAADTLADLHQLDASPQTVDALRRSLLASHVRMRTADHADSVRSVTLSTDGKRLATASRDKTARIWDARDGKLLATLTHERGVDRVAFNADGTRLVTIMGTTAVLWTAEGTQVAAFTADDVPLEDATFSADGRAVITVSRDGSLRAWEPPAAKRFEVHLPLPSPASVRFSGDGRKLVAVAAGTVHVVDVAEPASSATVPHAGSVAFAALSRDGTQVAIAGTDADVEVWDLGRHSSRILSGRPAPALDLSFSGDGSRLASGDEDGAVRVFDVATGQPIALLRGSVADEFEHVAVDDDGQWVVGASGKAARRWQVEASDGVHEFRGHTEDVEQAAFDATGTRIVTASGDGTARVWDVATGAEPRVLRADSRLVDAAFSPRGDVIVTVGEDESPIAWNAKTGQQLARLAGHREKVRSVAFASGGSLVATGSVDQTVRLWDADDNWKSVELKGHEGAVNAVAFSPDQRLLLSGSDDGTARVWDVQAHSAIAQLAGPAAVLAVAFQPDGNLAATGGEDGTVRLWSNDRGGWHEQRSFGGHRSRVLDVAFSPRDGRAEERPLYHQLLVSASRDGTARVWDVESGALVSELGHPGVVFSAVFSPDGNSIATAGGDRVLRVFSWPRFAPLEAIRAFASTRTTRALQDDERERFIGGGS